MNSQEKSPDNHNDRVEAVVDEDHLREEMLRTARSLPQNFPIILETFEESKDNPQIKEFTPEELDDYIEIVQEFSRIHERKEIRSENTVKSNDHPNMDVPSSSINMYYEEVMDNISISHSMVQNKHRPRR
jgi:hypothetical protein